MTALLLQPDGKIVAVGDSAPGSYTGEQIALARYEPNGSLDSSFGSGGVVETAMEPGGVYATGAVLQPDGKIVVAGYHPTPPSGEVFALIRYNPDGSLDTSFGSGGIVTTQVGDLNSEAHAVVLQPDGKIVAGGEFTNSTGGGSALVRYLPDGSLDTSFGSNGIVQDTNGENGFDALALQPDGKILGVGQRSPLTRYNSDGTRDASFGGPGGSGLALQTDGKIVVVSREPPFLGLTRVNPDGSVDTSFGNNGYVATLVGGGISVEAPAVTLQPDGKILVVATSKNGNPAGPDQFTLVRYNPGGSLDPAFGTGGIVTTLPSSWMGASAVALALQPDGKIDIAGQGLLSGGASWEFALARYLGSTLAVTKSGSGGGSVTSTPAGINCGASCGAPFAAVPVTLTATPAAGSVFIGWSGGGCSGTGTCQVTMSNDQSVTATFSLTPETLIVTKSGNGSGKVGSRPIGISCGSTCSQAYSYGTAVTMTASPASSSTFKGWSGACSGAGKCTVTMKQAQSATATFGLKPVKPACIVPKVKGKTLTIARRSIKRAHCRAGKITRGYSKVKKGRVISQNPQPRRHLHNWAKINLVISKGRRP